jgi:SulP family sulfate permease
MNLKDEFQPRVFVTTLTAALVTGTIAVTNTISYGVLIFSDELSPYVSNGVGVALFSGLILSLIVALMGSGKGLVAFPQAAIAPILALLAAGIVSMMGTTADMEQVFSTVIVALAFSAFFVGIVFATFGRFKLGKLIRFMPYPVIGGFLAGLGWLLIRGGLKVMSTQLIAPDGFSHLFHTEHILYWLPGAVLGIVFFVLLRRIKHYAVLPVALILSLLVFYSVVWISGTSLESLLADGWLLGPFPDAGLWKPISLGAFARADWIVILEQIDTLAILTLTSLIGILINCSGIELETQQDIDFDQDLQASGIANLLTSFGGGLVGYPSASLSILPHQIGARSRLVGVLTAILFAIALLFGGFVLAYLPRMIIGALLVYLGIGLLYRWLVVSRRSLPRYDYLILILILIVIGFVNLLMGVFVGVVATFALFALNYSRTKVVRNALTGENFQSNVDRAPYHQQYLQAQGGHLQILKLQGFIFFGTAFQIQSQVRERAENPKLPPLKFVIMDFRLVNGVDSSAMNSFMRMLQTAQTYDFKLAFADLNPDIEMMLRVSGVISKGEGRLSLFPNLDYAVEWCEDQILNEGDLTMVTQATLDAQLRGYFPDAGTLEVFMGYLEKQKVVENTLLIQQGDAPNGIFFVGRGQVRAELSLSNGETIRLRTMGEGTMVGELGIYLQRPATASVITEMPSTLYFLSSQTLKEMEKSDPKVAAAFHRYIATILGKRLIDTNDTVQALME